MFLPALLAFSPCLTSNASLVMFVFKSGLYNQTQVLLKVWSIYTYGQIRHWKTLMVNIYIYIYILFLTYVHVAWCGIILHHLNVTSFCYRDTDRGLEVTLSFPDLRCKKYVNDHIACLNGSPVVTSNSSLQDVFVGRKLLGGKCGILTFRNGPFQAQDSWKEDWYCRGLSDVMVGIPQSNYHGCDHF